MRTKIAIYLVCILALLYGLSWFGEDLKNIATNVFSDLITLVLFVLTAWFMVRLLRRNPLLDFFGVRKSRRLVIYLSNLNIDQGGSRGIDGQSRSYTGRAVVWGEVKVTNEFLNLFNYPFPAFDDKPGILKKLLIADVKVQQEPSPPIGESLERSTSFIALGSPGYNSASRFLEQEGSLAQFQYYNSKVIINDQPISTDGIYGFVERIVDSDRSLFYVAGTTETGTQGAAYYLATRWEELQNRYGNQQDFAIVLKINRGDYRESSVRSRYEREGTRRAAASKNTEDTENSSTKLLSDNKYQDGSYTLPSGNIPSQSQAGTASTSVPQATSPTAGPFIAYQPSSDDPDENPK